MVRRFKLVNTSGSWYIRDTKAELFPFYVASSNVANSVAEMVTDLNFQSEGAKASKISLSNRQVTDSASRHGVIGAQSRVNH